MSDRPTGLPGITGRVPIGAALTVGVKGPSGAPTEKDRFHIVAPQADAHDRRPHHPMFAPFNSAPAAQRASVVGTIAHDTWADCYEDRYRAQSGRGLQSHPARDASCMGDGRRARRWDGTTYQEIACLGEQCEYRQGDRAACKPWMRFIFQLQWSKTSTSMPTPLVKFTSQSWNTIAAFRGFAEHIQSAAAALQYDGFSLIGLPVQLTLSERTNKVRKSRFPVVTISPLGDPVAFFRGQIDDRARFLAAPRVAGLLDTTAADEAADYRAHVPGIASGVTPDGEVIE